MPTFSFVKRSGAPAGTINISVGQASFVIDDSTHPTITTTNAQVAADLRQEPYLAELGAPAPDPVAPPIEGVFLSGGVLSKRGPDGSPVAVDVGSLSPATPTTAGSVKLAGDFGRADSTYTAPRVGSISQRVAQPVYSKPLRVALIGLSVANANDYWPDNWPTNNPSGQSTAVTSRRGYGYLNSTNILLGQKLQIVHHATISGGQSGPYTDHSSLLYRLQDPSDSMYVGSIAEPDVYIVSDVPADDALSYADSLTNTIAIYDVLRAAWPNAVAIGCTVPGVTITNNAALRAVVNPGLRTYFAANRVRLFDMEAIFTDRTTGNPPAGETIDTLPSQIHPNYLGCLGRISKELARLLWPLVPQGDLMVTDYLQDVTVSTARGGWTTNALMTGTGGTMVRDVQFRSTIANGWSIDVGTGVTGGDTALIADEKFGFRQFVRLPPGLGSATQVNVSRSSTGPGGTGFPIGSIIGGECVIHFRGDLTNVQDIGLTVKGASATQYGQDGTVFGTNGGPAVDPGSGVALSFKIRPFKLASSETSIALIANVTAQSGSFEVSRASLQVLA